MAALLNNHQSVSSNRLPLPVFEEAHSSMQPGKTRDVVLKEKCIPCLVHCALVWCASVICIASTSASSWINCHGEKKNATHQPNGEALLCMLVCTCQRVCVCHSYLSCCHRVRTRVECELCLKGGKPAEVL